MASVFFDGVANALKTVQEHVVLEFVAGNLTQVLVKMRYDADETRPSGFPKLYTRAWLSNVPCVYMLYDLGSCLLMVW